jgi:hypothetical protein
LNIPRGRERFDRYLQEMTGGSSDAHLPLQLFNPMSKEHVAIYLERAISLRFEDAAHEAVAEATARLPEAGVEIAVSLVVADDLKGGWTNRFASEASICFEQAPLLKRCMIAAPLWTSDEPSRNDAHAEVLATCYRSAANRLVGPPRTLGEKIAQEGLVARFARRNEPRLTGDDAAYTRDVLGPHLSSVDPGIHIAALFGDEAARALGYRPLGLSRRAGLAIGLAAAAELDSITQLTAEARASFVARLGP